MIQVARVEGRIVGCPCDQDHCEKPTSVHIRLYDTFIPRDALSYFLYRMRDSLPRSGQIGRVGQC